MNNKVVGVICLVVGGAAGFFGAKLYLNEKYRKSSEEQLSAMREEYLKLRSEPKVSVTAAAPEENAATPVEGTAPKKTTGRPPEKPNLTKYAKYAKDLGYNNQPAKKDKPYFIIEEDFGDVVGYETVNLTLYSDGVLADDSDYEMSREEIEEDIGLDSLNRSNFTGDSMFIRNDKQKLDYEVDLDERTYISVVGERPYLQK